MTIRSILLAFSAVLASACGTAHADNVDIVRDLAGRVGPIVGSASACRDIAMKLLDRNIADGRDAIVKGQIDCKQAERQLAQLERSITAPAAGSPPAATALSVSPVDTAPPPNLAPF